MVSSPAPRDGQDEGMTLVEVLIAAVIMAILASSVLGIIVQTQSANVDSRARTAAASLAAREIDLVRQKFASSDAAPLDIANAGVVVNEHPLAGQTAGQPLRIDGRPYTVTRSASWNVRGPGTSACDGGALVAHPTLTVSVVVTWPHMGSTKPVVSQVQLAPPKGTGVSTAQAFIRVKVVDSLGQPNPGRTVRVSGGATTASTLTDVAGCGVVAVSPTPATGTTYSVMLNDAGYVDVTGAATPTKTSGLLLPGQLSSAIPFSYDRAAKLQVRIVDAAGAVYSDAEAVGTPLTIAATETSGASSTRTETATGAVTEFGNLWPTRYGAYYGTVPPALGYEMTRLMPGQVAQADVVLQLASARMVGLPDGANRLVAVVGGRACDDSTARDVAPGGFSVMPGSWSFYASGPAFDCAPGPSAVDLGAGDNGDVVYQGSSLRVVGAPATGRLWALSTTRAGGLTTCPDPGLAVHAIEVDAARAGAWPLPAGDWYVYRTDGLAQGSCLGVPMGAYPQNVPYAATATITWSERLSSVSLRVRDVPSLADTKDWFGRVTGRYRVIVTRSPGAVCSTTAPSDAVVLTTDAGSTSSATGTVEPGTVYVYHHQYVGGRNNTCTPAPGNPYVITGATPSVTARWTTGAVTSP